MLRNAYPPELLTVTRLILNEVLSLNAQECVVVGSVHRFVQLLNEVLSLNAQEYSKQINPPQ